MSDHTINALGTNLDTASVIATQTASQMVREGGYERLDFSQKILDKSLSIHQLGMMPIQRSEVVGQVCVFDLERVYVHPRAKTAIKNAYIMPLFLIEAFAQNYRDHLLRKLTRGNEKGLLVMDPEASTYVHRLRDGTEFVVNGETIEVEGTFTRRLTITCREQITEGCVQ